MATSFFDFIAFFLQQKATVLVSDWLPAIIDAYTCTKLWPIMQHKNLLTHSLACWFQFVVQNKSHTVFPCRYFYVGNRWCHKTSKQCSETTCYACCSTCSFEHFLTSSVINKRTDNGKLCDLLHWSQEICHFTNFRQGSGNFFQNLWDITHILEKFFLLRYDIQSHQHRKTCFGRQ